MIFNRNTHWASGPEFILWDKYCPERAERRAARLWQHARVFPLRKRYIYRRQVLFSFRVVFLADIKRVSLWSLLMDPAAEQPLAIRDLTGVLPLPRTWPYSSPWQDLEKRGADGRQRMSRWQPWDIHRQSIAMVGGDYELTRLYAKACQYLVERLPGALRPLKLEVDSRWKGERERLLKYYQQLSSEAMAPLRKHFRRLAAASVRAQLARSSHTRAAYTAQVSAIKKEIEEAEKAYQAYLSEIQQDMGWRLDELNARFTVRVQVSLAGIAFLWTPYVEFTLQVPRGGSELTCLYNCIADRFVDTTCESCGKLTDRLNSCPCGSLVCSSCFGSCPGCGDHLCTGCAAAVCSVCGGVVCRSCIGNCPVEESQTLPFGMMQTGAEESLTCLRCLEANCSMCKSLIEFGWL
ncbi:MAG: hypothetical protein GX063_05955 [Firmicutes bacterium]|nr:hypothetical protein [Bacillota bacterium]